MIVMARSVEPVSDDWEPKTSLGKMVKDGKFTSIYDIFQENLVIKEPEIVRALVPNLEYEVLEIRFVQKMTESGRRSKYRALVAVGNRNGLIGVGVGKAKQVFPSIQKALNKALLNIAPVRRGCGSWECGCGSPHSIYVSSEGTCGSVKVILKPGPRGLGIVAGDTARIVLELAGIEDVWAIAYGETRTPISFAMATYDALRNTYKIITKDMWSKEGYEE